MSSTRPAQKFITTLSTFQKLCLQNKPASERPKNKCLSWFSFGWTRPDQANSDGHSDAFNSTGVLADSIFIHAPLGAAALQQEKLITTCEPSCPDERVIEQQTTPLQPEQKDLNRQRYALPVDSKQAKGPLTGATKYSAGKQKPPFDYFQTTARNNYSDVKTTGSLQSNAELIRRQPYWVNSENDASTKTAKVAEGADDLQSVRNYCVKTVSDKSRLVMRSKMSVPATLASQFNTLKRLYSAKKDSTDKPPKSRKKDDEHVDFLKSKSPNKCKKKGEKCDPTIKPFKNAGPTTPSQMTRPSTPMTPRITEPGSLSLSFNSHKRYFSDKKETEAKYDKPEECAVEEAVQVTKPEECPVEEAVQVNKPEAPVETHRCAKAKCGPESVACPKPPPINQHRCPKKPVSTGRRKKRVKPDADTKPAK